MTLARRVVNPHSISGESLSAAAGQAAIGVAPGHDQPAPLIAHIIYRLDIGGLENGLVNLINSMPASRYRHAIICLTEAGGFRARLKDSSLPVFALHKRPGKDPAIYWRLWQLLRQLRPAIVHTRNLGTLDAAIPAALAGARTRVHGEHGWEVDDLHGRSRKYALLRKGCDSLVTHYIAVSCHIETWLRQTVGVGERRTTQIYNGVDTAKFYPPKGRILPSLPQFSDPDCIVIGTVGRMQAIKDPMTLVRSFLDLRQESESNARRLRLIMVGDGPLRAQALSALNQAGAGGVCWLPGARDDVADLLRLFDIFVLPSLNEGISNTILEAMATGLPVIATNVGGNPELVQHQKTGMLVPHSDPGALSRILTEYVSNPDMRMTHGSAGRQRVVDEFSLPAMVDRYLRVYDALLAPHTSIPQHTGMKR